MPATELAIAALTLLVPYLAKAGEKVAEKLTEAAMEKAEQLFKAIEARFKKQQQETNDDTPVETLEQFAEAPTDEANQNAMEEQLVAILQKDKEFEQSLLALLKEAQKAGATFTTNISGGKVGQVINVDKLEGGLNITNK